jgi:TusA-related sulfurtransferase
MADFELDLTGVACPMNFVKTRLFLDKITSGDLLKVILDSGEPLESVSSSVQSEGHEIVETVKLSDRSYSLSIRKA